MFAWSPLAALYAVWIVWIVSWELAALWSSRAQATPGLRPQSFFRVFTQAGFLLVLFMPPWPWDPGRWKSVFAQPVLKTLTTPLWSTPETLGWVLAGIAAAGFLFCWWARIHLGALWSSAITRKADHHIVDTGPYGLVRHPIYTGILTLGWALALDKATPAALAGAASLCVGYWMKSRMEEGFLRSELGAEAYDAYSKRVPMLVPFLLTKR
ncbi:MAG TPA: isoprenylcysteine carboxylmethyltransferase family protein [Caulobacteraceae bacterium]|jgi:protein-S-isoprenylcysteine O-methyltransferase Ste14|nr:isoprenylcysteine carboxylmethyltransferase family protein [Caulobacteraceae bacterium]